MPISTGRSSHLLTEVVTSTTHGLYIRTVLDVVAQVVVVLLGGLGTVGAFLFVGTRQKTFRNEVVDNQSGLVAFGMP